VPTLTATMLLSTHVEAPSSKRRPLFQDTAKISICHQSTSSCFDAPTHFVSNESSVYLELAASAHQSLRLAGVVFVAAELLPCAFHFETRLPIKTFRMLFYNFGSISLICLPIDATVRTEICIL
jgi:hypothetical protein